jgi:hypothetical protein
MAEAWFTSVADELAEALLDARECAAACEALLEAARGKLDGESERRLLAALVAPAAIARVMIELIDRPPTLLLAAARVCREASARGNEELERLELPLDTARVSKGLAAASESCRRLLEAAGAP